MTLTVAEITEICQELSDKYDDTFDIPVTINKRFTSTFGRVLSEPIAEDNDYYQPIKLEISASFLQKATYDSIVSVIKHEWAHYYLIKSTGYPHGHDAKFKALCAEIDCEGSATYIPETSAPLMKYTVFCRTCNKEVGYYSRMCGTLKYLDECFCAKCGEKNLTYIQNF
jgi:predicted SprT family Zn-dependent metalloprotease